MAFGHASVMHQALARERSHQMGLESLGPGAKRLILATPLQDILKFRNDPLLYIVLNPLCMDGQIVAVCLVKKSSLLERFVCKPVWEMSLFRYLFLNEEWGEPIPTAYSYGYLWAAHTLFYWHRDQDMVWASLSKSFKWNRVSKLKPWSFFIWNLRKNLMTRIPKSLKSMDSSTWDFSYFAYRWSNRLPTCASEASMTLWNWD